MLTATGNVDAWKHLGEEDIERLQRNVAGLPSEVETDEIEALLFRSYGPHHAAGLR